MIVAKFGGSAMADGENWQRVLNIAADRDKRVVVVSAPGARFVGDEKVTDLLFKYAESDKNHRKIVWEKIAARYENAAAFFGVDFSAELNETALKLTDAPTPYVVSRGEYLCAKLFSVVGNRDFLDAADVIKFDEKGNVAQKLTAQLIRQALSQSKNGLVIGGFYGSDKDGNVVLFERGGSDISGAIVAAAVDAEIYENWTDVSGVFCCDPRVVLNPVFVKCLSFFQMKTLASLGAKILHPQTVYPAIKKNIPINIKSIYHPRDDGTLILPTTKKNGDVVGITTKKVVYIEQTAFKTPLAFSQPPLFNLSTPAFCIAVFDEENFNIAQINGDGVLVMSRATLISVVYDGKKSYLSSIKKALKKSNLFARTLCEEHGLALCLSSADKAEQALRAVYGALE